MHEVSAVIITYNEENNIGRCIDSVRKVTDDIVVTDSHSTDRTEAICKEMGVRFYTTEKKGYGPKKNFGNEKAKNEFVLSIDADEEVSEELASSIKKTMAAPKADAFELSFLNNYCGKWVRHGRWYPDRHIRIFNKHKIRWNDAEVHEELILPPETTIERLRGHVNHYTINSLQEHREKIRRYSDLAANKMYRKGKKASFLKIYIAPWAKFLYDYIILGGFLDGYYGYCLAMYSSFESYLKYVKLKKLHRKSEK